MSADDTAKTEAGTQRLDKWLWFTRLVKSRTLAASLVSGGKVRLNRVRVEKPSHVVRVGDVVTATAHQRVRVLKVLALGERRGPPAAARLLYEDLSPPVVSTGPPMIAAGPTSGGRPTKKERRELTALKRGT